MKELTVEQVSTVSGGGWGAVVSCFVIGRVGLKVGAAFGPWGAVGGVVGGCITGVGLYYLP